MPDKAVDAGTPPKGKARLIIGSEQNPFDIDLDQLCAWSPFFCNALDGRFKEATTRTVTLPEDQPEVFRIFKRWLEMRGKAPPTSYSINEYSLKHTEQKTLDIPSPAKLRTLLQLWVLADKLAVPVLQNETMSLIVRKYAEYNGRNIPPDLFDYVYKNSPPNSVLRRVMVKFAAGKMDPIFYDQFRSELHGELLEDLVLEQMNQSRLKGPIPLYLFAAEFYVPSKPQDSIVDPKYPDVSIPATAQQLANRTILKPHLRKPRHPLPDSEEI